ncbi:MAG: ankyrin repeat domain-containing protein, partial [Bdellovibrionales bacterium]
MKFLFLTIVCSLILFSPLSEAWFWGQTTPLIQSAKKGDLKKVQTLIRTENIHAKDHYGSNALMWASWKGHAQIAKLLLQKGANPNATDKKGQT